MAQQLITSVQHTVTISLSKFSAVLPLILLLIGASSHRDRLSAKREK